MILYKVDDTTQNWSLTIRTGKTSITKSDHITGIKSFNFVLALNEIEKTEESSQIKFRGEAIEQVQNFQYLGCLLDKTIKSEAKIDRRIRVVIWKFAELDKSCIEVEGNGTEDEDKII